MSTTIFENETTNVISELHRVNGNIQVCVSGVLDGADIITYKKMDNGADIPIYTCSWMSSKGDILNTADGGYENILNSEIFFQIINAGASTNLSVEFDVV